jgi:hypothetical protein
MSKNSGIELLGSKSKKESRFDDADLVKRQAGIGILYTIPAPLDHGDATRTRVKNAPQKVHHSESSDTRSKYLKRRDKKLNARIAEFNKVPDSMRNGFTRPGSNN